MAGIGVARTKIERQGDARARRLRRQLGDDIRRAREDAGLSGRRLAGAAGISHSTLISLEEATVDPNLGVASRVATAPGSTLYLRMYEGTGPTIRDHLQSAMVSELLRELHPRWRPEPEVAVHEPVRGVIDLVMGTTEPPLVACESHSELRRLEQLIRWAKVKAEALAQARNVPVARLLLLRSTGPTRATAAAYAELIAAAYPARCADVFAAVTGQGGWPGDGILWCTVEGEAARLLDAPPRGVRLGR